MYVTKIKYVEKSRFERFRGFLRGDTTSHKAVEYEDWENEPAQPATAVEKAIQRNTVKRAYTRRSPVVATTPLVEPPEPVTGVPRLFQEDVPHSGDQELPF